MIRRPPRSTQSRSSAASDVYKRQAQSTRPSRSGDQDPRNRPPDLSRRFPHPEGAMDSTGGLVAVRLGHDQGDVVLGTPLGDGDDVDPLGPHGAEDGSSDTW